jgi:hypothetical protein
MLDSQGGKYRTSNSLSMGALSSVAAIVGAIGTYFLFPGTSPVVFTLALIAVELTLGIGIGFFACDASIKSIGFGAFVGLLIVWTPVVAVTYGFALLALPLLFLTAGALAVGSRLGRKVRIKRNVRGAPPL